MGEIVVFDKTKDISKEQIQEVREAAKRPIEFDEDCPELSTELQKAFKDAVKNRNMGAKLRPIVKETLDLIDMLPDEYVAEVHDYTKTLVKKWDPDYTKLTPSEEASLVEAEEQIKNGEVVSEYEVWSGVGTE